VSEGAPVGLRRKRGARVVRNAAGVTAYPEPYDAPVLPAGWAPLGPGDEAAVLRACDAAAEDCRLRLGSLWDPAGEFRSYGLEAGGWRGVCAATFYRVERCDTGGRPHGRNVRLLAITHSSEEAMQIALDFLNWELEADGSPWRLTPAVRERTDAAS
jgi:hypothetical protein